MRPGVLDTALFLRRRTALCAALGRPILLMGNGLQPRNVPMNALPFRQDSSFLYYTGCALPGAAALLRDGHCTLFLPLPAPDDALWHGELPTAAGLQTQYGVEALRPIGELEGACRGLELATLAVSDPVAPARGAPLTRPPRARATPGPGPGTTATRTSCRPSSPSDASRTPGTCPPTERRPA